MGLRFELLVGSRSKAAISSKEDICCVKERAFEMSSVEPVDNSFKAVDKSSTANWAKAYGEGGCINIGNGNQAIESDMRVARVDGT